jgi:hypothetical protein
MNCHSERSEESPHFSRGTTVYTISENALTCIIHEGTASGCWEREIAAKMLAAA